jgi:predicted lipoprotein with Yx(FWY)xxD motif
VNGKAKNCVGGPRVIGLLVASLLAGCANLAQLPASAQGFTVQVAEDPELGVFLTDPQGMTLYVHEGETEDQLICVGQCLSDWRPYLLASGEPVAPPELTDLGGVLGTVVRQGNQRQVTYDGMPLYYWKEDRRKGDALGNGHENRTFAANIGPVVHVQVHPEFGEILVGPNGMTLYTFERDEADMYGCEEGCAQNFPPLVVAGLVRQPPGLTGRTDKLERYPDDFHGQRFQVTYDGRPLYYFARDESPGDVRGNGISGYWAVAQP